MASDVSQEASKATAAAGNAFKKAVGFGARRINPLSMSGLPATIGLAGGVIAVGWLVAPAMMIGGLAGTTPIIAGAGLGTNIINGGGIVVSQLGTSLAGGISGATSTIVTANWSGVAAGLGQAGSALTGGTAATGAAAGTTTTIAAETALTTTVGTSAAPTAGSFLSNGPLMFDPASVPATPDVIGQIGMDAAAPVPAAA